MVMAAIRAALQMTGHGEIAYGNAIGDLAVAGHGRGGGDHDLRQGGADGHHRGTDEQLRHLEAAGDAGCTVHEPVAALDEAEQAHDKQ